MIGYYIAGQVVAEARLPRECKFPEGSLMYIFWMKGYDSVQQIRARRSDRTSPKYRIQDKRAKKRKRHTKNSSSKTTAR